MNRKKKPLSIEDIEICANLNRIWSAKRIDLSLSQQKAADKLGITQGAISHQLKGRNALHTDSIIAWADLLKCKEIDIDPNRKYAAGHDNPQLHQEISELLDRAGQGNHQAVMAMLRSFVGQLKPQHGGEKQQS